MVHHPRRLTKATTIQTAPRQTQILQRRKLKKRKAMVIRFLFGIIFLLITIPMNHIDLLFPNFTEFVFLGNSYQFLGDLASRDIIWTIVQKINIIFMAFGSWFIFRSLTHDNSQYNKLNFVLKAVLIGLTAINIYLSIRALQWYASGFTNTAFIATYIFVVATIIIIALIARRISNIAASKKNQQRKLLKQTIMEIQDTNFALIEDVQFLENIPKSIKVDDFMEAWHILSTDKAREAYDKIMGNIQNLDKIGEENDARKR